MHRVLVVGGKASEAKALAFRLSIIGFETIVSAAELSLALRQVFAFQPNAIVLDCDGNQRRDLFCLLERICELPIVVLGDGNSENQLVWYLEQGAADYLAKPISPSLLAARLRGLLRHTKQEKKGQIIRAGDLVIDVDGHEVRRKGRIISLTPTEFRLLHVLAERPGHACSQRMLLKRVWGEEFADCAHYLRLYMGYLRQKLEDDPKRPKLLVTQWGVGYRLLERPSKPTIAQLPTGRKALA